LYTSIGVAEPIAIVSTTMIVTYDRHRVYRLVSNHINKPRSNAIHVLNHMHR